MNYKVYLLLKKTLARGVYSKNLTLLKEGGGGGMNKIKSSVNIFIIFPPSLLKKSRREKTKFAAGNKNESCAEYTPLEVRENDAQVISLPVFIQLLNLEFCFHR